MAKMTVDEMIERLSPDRQKAIQAKAKKINEGRDMASARKTRPQFENLDHVIARLPLEKQEAIEAGAEQLAREIEASRLKSGVTVNSLEEKHEEHE